MKNIPDDLQYTESHEWIRFKGKIYQVCITDHAQHELTDIVFVELPTLGKKVEAGKPTAVVESVKVASDIYAPISGTITKVNTALEEKPDLINLDPYGEGWIFEIETENVKTSLLDSKAYRKLTE